jgi:TrmH family RNA methyltransferase
MTPEIQRPAIVLVSPKEAGNVGSVARAMKNFGLTDLRIVQPRFQLEKALLMAVHAFDVVEGARVFDTLLDAVGDCELVAGTTARVRRDHAPPITPREVAPRFSSVQSSAVVFGREEHGLFNDELDLCHVHIRIPTDAVYVSMNLAQAVQVVVYELMMSRTNPEPIGQLGPQADRRTMEGLYAHLLAFMLEVSYTDENRQDHAMRRFRQIFDRAELTKQDVSFVRGLLSQGLWTSRKARGYAVPGTVPWPRDAEDSNLENTVLARKTAPDKLFALPDEESQTPSQTELPV